MNADAPPNPFETLWRMGYRRLTPITPPGCAVWPELTIAAAIAKGRDSRGKAPGVRRGEAWTGYPFLARPTLESDLDGWREMGAGVGILTGEGLVGIDADCLRAADAAACGEIISAALGPLPIRVGRAPKALYVCRTDPDFGYARLSFGEGERVEILGEGRQFVAWGIHPGTLAAYAWPRKLCPLDELPYASPAALLGLLETLRARLPAARAVERSGGDAPTDQESLKGELSLVREAVRSTPNTSEAFPTRESYLDYGYAIKAALVDHPGEGLALFSAWCARWTGGENDEETVESDWRRMKAPYRRGAAWLYETAERASGGSFSRAAAWFETVPPPPSIPHTSANITNSKILSGEVKSSRPTPWRFPNPTSLPTRATLYGGHYCRKFVSSTIAPSKVGKSSLALVEALSMASGKPLLGITPTGLWRVWWWNGEDPQDELDRRVAAAIQFYGLTREDLGNRLMVDNGRDTPIRLAIQEKSGAKIVEVELAALIRDILENRIDVTIIDPLISAHRVSENDNNAIDVTVKECARITNVTSSAIELIHHTRKLYGSAATVEDGRGASALLAATRSTRALAKMTRDEAAELGVTIDHRLLFRFGDVSSNIAAPDPSEDRRWFRLESVDLGNGEGAEPIDRIANGDSVGVVARFDLDAATDAALADASDDAGEAAALAAVRRQECRNNPRSAAWVGVPIALALGIDRESKDGAAKLKTIIRQWLRAGKLVEENRVDEHRHVKTYVIAPVQDVKITSADLFE